MTGYNKRKDVVYVPLISASDDEGGNHKEVKSWRWPPIVIIFWIAGSILVGIVYLFSSIELESLLPFDQIAKFPELPDSFNSLNGYLINTPGCRIPEMDPRDHTVITYIFKPDEINCKGLPPLFNSNLTSLFIVNEHLSHYKITNMSDLKCYYQEFWRRDPIGNEKDTQIAFSKSCTPLTDTVVDINVEFVKVLCNDTNGKHVYEDYFAFVPLKKKVDSPPTSGVKPNILVLGLDAVSRVNVHRQLPKTCDYLNKELHAVEMLGYNKVADNTFVNLIPVLTGLFEGELKKACWPSSNSRFDKCSFLWHNFSKQGYLTAYGEDCAWIGIFNYGKKGFIKQSTDYYFTSFNGKMENSIGTYKDFNCVECVGGRKTYEVTLDYIRKFVLRMKVDLAPYFGFFWSSTLSHDYLNRPALGDENYLDLLHYLKENDHLKNTVLILMSDHGIRWGGIRQTYQGQLEERLPFVFIVLPDWMKEKYPMAVRNLNKNSRRLTTPFDLHETLQDLLDLNNLKSVKKIVKEPVFRGYSLFNEIPSNRTCEDAAIDSHWCTCQQSVEVMPNDTIAVAAAEFAVNNINSLLEGYAQCATLGLDSILNARVLYYDAKHFTDKKSVKDYTITLKTMPGEAVFEVTVRNKEKQQQVLKTRTDKPSTVSTPDRWENFTVTGTVSRLNLYGKQSYCITDFHLKLYCYCKSLLQF